MYQKIERYLKNLSKRERLVLMIAGAVLGLFVLTAGVISPVVEYRDRLESSIGSKEAQLKRASELSSKIRVAQASGGVRTVQQADFTLFGFLEDLAAKVKVNDRIEYMKPISDSSGSAREAVEVRIRSVFQDDLVSLLYDIEHSPHALKIKRLNVRRVDRDGTLDVTFQVVHHG
ncbi:MAG: type II secretion system protein GspM [Desulfomonilia bacterium]|jgi:type II secretory pathway component PulM